ALGESAALADRVEERRAVDELHDVEEAPVDAAGVVEADDVRMPDLGDRLRLGEEDVGVLAGAVLGPEELDRDLAVDELVARAQDDARRSLAEDVGQLVARDRDLLGPRRLERVLDLAPLLLGDDPARDERRLERDRLALFCRTVGAVAERALELGQKN